MGEMADMILQNIFDSMLLDDEEEGPLFYENRKCRCCGEEFLVWGKSDGKWRLFKERADGSGADLHECPVNPLKEG